MKFLIDAQLPPSLKKIFIENGYDCIHIIDLLSGNETYDTNVYKISIEEKRVLITKDSGFLHSFTIKREPYKLILVKLGNTSKKELLNLFSDKFSEIITKLKEDNMIFIRKESL